MKRLQLIGAVLLSSAVLVTQASDNKSGPAAKNRKNREKDRNFVIVTTKSVKKRGAALKNQKPWAEAVISATKIESTPRKKKGPKAKNSKPWDN